MSLDNQLKAWESSCPSCPPVWTILAYCTAVECTPPPKDVAPETIEEFRSCRLLLEHFPEARGNFRRLTYLSQRWADLVSFWDDLCMIQDLEQPDWRDWREKKCQSPKTKKMLQTIISRT